MRSSLTIASVSPRHPGKYWCSPSQVTPDSVTVLVKSHADIGHSEPVTNMGRKAKHGAWILVTLVL